MTIPKVLDEDRLVSIFKEEYTDDPEGFLGGLSDSFAVVTDRARSSLDGKNIERYVPTVFEDRANELEMIPRADVKSWPTLDAYLDFFAVKTGVLLNLPPFWQLEPQCFYTCRQHGLYIYQGALSNTPATAEVVSKAQIEFAVGSTAGISSLLEEIKNKQKPHRLHGLLQILSPEEAASVPSLAPDSLGIPLQKEVHLIPGYVICHQPPAYLNEVRDGFSLSEDYIWQLEGAETYITAYSQEALPVRRLKLPFTLEETDDPGLYKILHGN